MTLGLFFLGIIFALSCLLVLFFVDDIISMYRREHRQYYEAFWQRLEERYHINNSTIFLSFSECVLSTIILRELFIYARTLASKKVLHRFHLEQYRPVQMPLPSTSVVPNPVRASSSFTHLYQQKVGSALYLAIMTRPDAANGSCWNI